MTEYLTTIEVDALAAELHTGQTDKAGVDYINHPRAVAAAMRPFGDIMVQVGLLHDAPEDCLQHLTLDERFAWLLERGVNPVVLDIVRVVTRKPGSTYMDMIREIAASTILLSDVNGSDSETPCAVALKLADNGENSLPERVDLLNESDAKFCRKRYGNARAVLVTAADPATLAILEDRYPHFALAS